MHTNIKYKTRTDTEYFVLSGIILFYGVIFHDLSENIITWHFDLRKPQKIVIHSS